MVIYNSNIPKWFGFDGMTLWPFVFVIYSKSKTPAWLIRHEEVHLRQQKEWFLIGFYVVYLYDYVIGRINGKSHDAAYRAIRFEVEAYKIASP